MVRIVNYLGRIILPKKEKSFFEEAMEFLKSFDQDKQREATSFEKFVAENFSQDELNNIINNWPVNMGPNIPDNQDPVANTLTGLPSYKGENEKYTPTPGDSAAYIDHRENGGYRIGVKLKPGGGISPINSRPVKNKKDSVKYEIQ